MCQTLYHSMHRHWLEHKKGWSVDHTMSRQLKLTTIFSFLPSDSEVVVLKLSWASERQTRTEIFGQMALRYNCCNLWGCGSTWWVVVSGTAAILWSGGDSWRIVCCSTMWVEGKCAFETLSQCWLSCNAVCRNLSKMEVYKVASRWLCGLLTCNKLKSCNLHSFCEIYRCT